MKTESLYLKDILSCANSISNLRQKILCFHSLTFEIEVTEYRTLMERSISMPSVKRVMMSELVSTAKGVEGFSTGGGGWAGGISVKREKITMYSMSTRYAEIK